GPFWHALLPDGVTLVTFQSYWRNQSRKNDLLLWDVRTGRRIGQVWMPWLSFVSYDRPHLSPDGQTVLFVQNLTLQLFDVPSRAFRHQIDTKRSIGPLAFHPNSRLLAVASSRTNVTLWDVVERRRLERYDWQCGNVRALAFAPDGQTCAA